MFAREKNQVPADESMRNIPAPGGFRGLIGSNPETPLSRVATELDLPHAVINMAKDTDFYPQFAAAVPNPEEQARFLKNTAQFLLEQESDPRYVLMFRRTLPSPAPKPEAHWTSDFVTARNGLRNEIPEGPHRYHSVILCATLAEILKEGGLAPDSMPRGTSDGEIKIVSKAFEQARSIVIFKPAHESEKLNTYMTRADALGINQVLAMVKDAKRQ